MCLYWQLWLHEEPLTPMETFYLTTQLTIICSKKILLTFPLNYANIISESYPNIQSIQMFLKCFLVSDIKLKLFINKVP